MRSPTTAPTKLRLRVACGVTAAAAALTAAVVTPAAAAPADVPYTSVIQSNSGGAWWRAQPNTSSQKMNYLRNGQAVHMDCWTTGELVSPPNSNYTSNRWFKVQVPEVS